MVPAFALQSLISPPEDESEADEAHVEALWREVYNATNRARSSIDGSGNPESQVVSTSPARTTLATRQTSPEAATQEQSAEKAESERAVTPESGQGDSSLRRPPSPHAATGPAASTSIGSSSSSPVLGRARFFLSLPKKLEEELEEEAESRRAAFPVPGPSNLSAQRAPSPPAATTPAATIPESGAGISSPRRPPSPRTSTPAAAARFSEATDPTTPPLNAHADVFRPTPPPQPAFYVASNTAVPYDATLARLATPQINETIDHVKQLNSAFRRLAATTGPFSVSLDGLRLARENLKFLHEYIDREIRLAEAGEAALNEHHGRWWAEARMPWYHQVQFLGRFDLRIWCVEQAPRLQDLNVGSVIEGPARSREGEVRGAASRFGAIGAR